MTIIIPTNDRETIAIHIIRCREFAKYEIEGGKIISQEFFKNNYLHSAEEYFKNNKESCHLKEMIQFFKTVDFITYYAMGKKLKEKLNVNKILYQKAKSVYLEEILKELLCTY